MANSKCVRFAHTACCCLLVIPYLDKQVHCLKLSIWSETHSPPEGLAGGFPFLGKRALHVVSLQHDSDQTTLAGRAHIWSASRYAALQAQRLRRKLIALHPWLFRHSNLRLVQGVSARVALCKAAKPDLGHLGGPRTSARRQQIMFTDLIVKHSLEKAARQKESGKRGAMMYMQALDD